jgi:hypothetical protein
VEAHQASQTSTWSALIRGLRSCHTSLRPRSRLGTFAAASGPSPGMPGQAEVSHLFLHIAQKTLGLLVRITYCELGPPRLVTMSQHLERLMFPTASGTRGGWSYQPPVNFHTSSSCLCLESSIDVAFDGGAS